MVFERLRAETSALHAEVEALVPILDRTVTARQYGEFLAALRGFHAHVERRLDAIAGLRDVIPDLDRRHKATLLDADLAALGIDSTTLPEVDAWPRLDTVDDAIGCLYVVEGSTLGGQHIHRHLASVLPAVARDASRFLTCYGARTGWMWNAFRQRVEQVEPGLDADAIVASACRTFAAVKDWFAQRFGTAPPTREAAR